MGLPDLISRQLEVVRVYTEDLQADVQIEAWVGEPESFGGPERFDVPIIVPAFCQEGEQHHKRSDGQVITTKARLVLLKEVPPNGALLRREPIDPRDRITLPSGATGHLAELPGVQTNPFTGQSFNRVVWIE
jgi:hypothetical protein